MKMIKNWMLFTVLTAVVLVSCKKDEDPADPNPVPQATQIAYIVNYGSYSGSKSEISIYNTETDSISQDNYKKANAVDFTSNIQSMAIHNDIAYFMSNNGDKIDIVDAKTLVASGNPISEDITKPRYFVADGTTAYISCWGVVDDWTVMANSYIAKIDLETKAVSKIALPGGPEGVTIIDNNLYVAMTTAKKIAVIDLSSQEISYITTLAIPYHFVVDNAGYLWASMVSTYTVPVGADSVGLAKIDPANNTVIANVNYSGIGSNGYMEISNDKIYVMGSEVWPGTGSSIAVVDALANKLDNDSFITGESFYGFGVNPTNHDIYVLISPNATDNGTLKIYSSEGVLQDEEPTGIGPQHVVFYDVK